MFRRTNKKNEIKAKLTVHETLEGYSYLLVGKVLNQTGFDWEKQFQPVQNPNKALQTIQRQNQDKAPRKNERKFHKITRRIGSLVLYRGGYKEMSSIVADQWRPRMWAQMEGGRGSCWYQPMYTGAQINFGDLIPYYLWFCTAPPSFNT